LGKETKHPILRNKSPTLKELRGLGLADEIEVRSRGQCTEMSLTGDRNSKISESKNK